ncbi:hypothetical protein [Agromyces seonyuensis]|uniref:Uncharacterized protein n=1 Tax=Agromyces seonyuensis TaxID=2662446 RepID=A0A6I4NRT8_9MICO|nr:hypothetical protein [Agromyces seonyuensis]MWB97188.1 hypothetical protein [Agromyces seonyuensis]
MFETVLVESRLICEFRRCAIPCSNDRRSEMSHAPAEPHPETGAVPIFDPVSETAPTSIESAPPQEPPGDDDPNRYIGAKMPAGRTRSTIVVGVRIVDMKDRRANPLTKRPRSLAASAIGVAGFILYCFTASAEVLTATVVIVTALSWKSMSDK